MNKSEEVCGSCAHYRFDPPCYGGWAECSYCEFTNKLTGEKTKACADYVTKSEAQE